MRFWLFTGLGWGIAALAFIGIAEIPGRNLDFYFSDRYVSVSKVTLFGAVVLGVVLPLAAVTIRYLRLRRR